MKPILLSQGFVAFVDDSDFESVQKHKWSASKIGRRIYAVRKIRKADGRGTSQYLHQFILPGVPEVDHKDGDGLNCQRHNLRPATALQNRRASRRKAFGKSSKYRGVSWAPRDQKWRAEIKLPQKKLHLGYFSKPEEAARAYDQAAREYYGDFAAPNFP